MRIVLSATVRPALLLVVAIVLGSCLLQPESPELELGLEDAYSDDNITVPYRVFGMPSGSILEWEVSVDTGTDYLLLWEEAVRINREDSGLIEMGFLGEGLYQVVFRVATFRGSELEDVPSLGRAAYFYVDRTPPTSNAVVGDFTPAPGSPTLIGPDGRVAVAYDDSTDPNLLSPQRVLVAVGSGVRPPVVGIDELEPGILGSGTRGFDVWSETPHSVGATVTVTWVVVDEAGNRSTLSTGTYEGN